MKIIKFPFLLILCLLALPFTGIASHMMGAEITYKWVGNKKYEVTARIYRDCRGIPLNSPDFKISDYNGTTYSLSYNRTSIEDITVRCSDTISAPCNPTNTTVSIEGIELHTFVATVDFNTSPFNNFRNNGVCKVYFSVEQCCRNGAITTLNTGNFYVDAMLDLCASGFKNTSPQFKGHNVMNAQCNVPFYQNFGSKDFIDYDSLAYELVNPLNAANSKETYSGSFNSSVPMSPFCATTGVINCAANPNAKPPRGFYFNKLTGDIVFVPVNCSEVGVIAVKITEYRRDSTNSKWLTVGYVMRDIQIVNKVVSGINYTPTVTLAGTYNFRTREKTCIDIKSFDTIAAGASSTNRGDVTKLKIIELPEGASFRYVDSNARNKTGRLCWTIHDSVYLKFKNKDKLMPLTLELRDNFCSIPYIIQKSFNIKILPPDSSGYLILKTFSDPNKNNYKDNSEKGLPVLMKFKDKSSAYYVETDENGLIQDSIGKGKVTIGMASHPYLTSSQKDTALIVKMDSTHTLNFGINLKNGIYGRIYSDENNNCKYDKNEPVFKGYKVFTDSNKYVGISDNNGIYFISAPKGNYNLKCNYRPFEYKVTCPSSGTISLSATKDSAYQNNDFGIATNPDYTDIATSLSIDRLRRGNLSSVTLYCGNFGPKTRKNIRLFCPVSSKFDLTYNSSLYAAAGTTANIKIDSLQAGQTFKIKLDFFVSPTGFKAGDKICFSVKTDSMTTANDSVTSNNAWQDCRVVDAPYDPNEKLISIDSTRTTLDKTISYTIHFQNTGTDTATRVVVTDTLNTLYLDPAGFVMNWSDYPCETVLAGNVIHFIFNNIHLPFASTSGDKSMAGFNFTMGLKSDVKQEISFTNRASIYFDFEDAVITKNSRATIVSPVKIIKVDKPDFCRNTMNKIHYRSNIAFSQGNQFILELSDNKGQFGSPVVLKTVAGTSGNDSLLFGLPRSVSSGTYQLRIRTTHPQSVSIPVNGQYSITAYPIPTAGLQSVNTTLNNNIGCENDTLKLNFADKNYYYKIIRNHAAMNNFSFINAYKYLLNKNDSFLLLAMDPGSSCTDTLALNPVVHPKPVITASIPNRKAIYCEKEALQLQAGGGEQYIYYKNAMPVSALTSDSDYTAVLDAKAVYWVKGIHADGCSNLSDTLHVEVKPAPPATLTSFPDPVCTGDSVTLIYGNAPTYDLYKNNVKIMSKTGANTYKIKDLTEGDKYKTISNGANGCTAESKELIIRINPLPLQPVIIQNKNDLNVNYTGSIKWYRNGVLLAQNNGTYTNAPGGIYTVVVTNAEGCSSTSNTFVHRNSGLAAVNAGALRVYPNPAQETLYIEWLGPEQELSLCLMDMNGKVVYEVNIDDRTEIVNLTEFASGLYTLRVSGQNGSVASQLISIQR